MGGAEAINRLNFQKHFCEMLFSLNIDINTSVLCIQMTLCQYLAQHQHIFMLCVQINAQTALLQLEQLQQLQTRLQAQQAQVQVQVQQAQNHAQVRPQVQLPAQLSGQPQVLQISAQPQSQALISQPPVQIPSTSLAGVVPSTLQPQLTAATLRSLGINLAPTTSTIALPPDSDEVVKAQAKKIDELQRQLEESEIRLQLHILQQQLLLQQQPQQQLQGQPLLQVQLPQASPQSSPQSLLAQVIVKKKPTPLFAASPQFAVLGAIVQKTTTVATVCSITFYAVIRM